MRYDPQTGQQNTNQLPVTNTGNVNSGYPQQPIVVNMPPQTNASPSQETFTREDIMAFIEKARQEEKDKLYPDMEAMSARIKVFEDEAEAHRLADEQRQAEEAEAERRRTQEEQTVAERWESFSGQWQERLDEMSGKLEQSEALRKKETEYAALADYRGRRLAELGDQIDPRFHKYIVGNNPEEVEAALAQAAADTAEIGGEFQEVIQQRRREAGLPVSGQPSVTPEQMGNQMGRQEVSPADIAAMDMSRYAELRPQLLQAGSDLVRDQGLYGNR